MFKNVQNNNKKLKITKKNKTSKQSQTKTKKHNNQQFGSAPKEPHKRFQQKQKTKP